MSSLKDKSIKFILSLAMLSSVITPLTSYATSEDSIANIKTIQEVEQLDLEEIKEVDNELVKFGNDLKVYINKDGSYKSSGYVLTNKHYYTFDGDIFMEPARNKWVKFRDGRVYFAKQNSFLAKGITRIGNKFYYFDRATGKLVKNKTLKSLGKTYRINGRGEVVGYNKVLNQRWRHVNGETYYIKTDGKKATGIYIIDGRKYAFTSSGKLMKNRNVYTASRAYKSGSDGTLYPLRKTFVKVNGSTRYVGSNGYYHKGLLSLNGKQYYFYPYSYALMTNTRTTINGVEYVADTNGVLRKSLKDGQIIDDSYAAKLKYKKPNFLNPYFKDVKTQDKYVLSFVKTFRRGIRRHDVTDIGKSALADPKVKLYNKDDLEDFFETLLVLSPFYTDFMDSYIYNGNGTYIYTDSDDNIREIAFVSNTSEQVNEKTFRNGEYSQSAFEESWIRKVDAETDKIVADAKRKYKSDRALAEYFAQYIYEHNDYYTVGTTKASSPVYNNAYGALFKGKSRCAGFSELYTILCRKAGIPAHTVIGNASSSTTYRPEAFGDTGHAWNIVFIDGKWYYVDNTGLVASKWLSPNYFLDGQSGKYFHEYGLIRTYGDMPNYLVK